MLAGMSGRDFHEWRAYADLEPFDEERADARAAYVVQTLRNQNRGRRRAFTLEECMPKFGDAVTAAAPREDLSAATVEARRASIRRTMDSLVKTHNRKFKAKTAKTPPAPVSSASRPRRPGGRG